MAPFKIFARRRVVASAATVALAVTGLSVVNMPSAFADPTVLKVVGTSDVSDSHLMQSVIEPGFEQKYPQYDLQYTGTATGTAISTAEAGGAAALIVHAPALENQFVDAGYSAEPWGRAIFWGDYILAGAESDTAGVGANAGDDIVKAYEDVATAGINGDATFVSRGGTPGTTVQEHQIWAAVEADPNIPAGLTLCQVPDASGGGYSPSTTSGACSSPISYPSWYSTTGLTQGPNVQAADACNTDTFPNGNCYVFTDRGTFQYLQSQNSLATLKLLVRRDDNTPSSETALLVNSFHAYAINPAKFTGTNSTDLVGATDFLDYLTSSDLQQALLNYPTGTTDPPFLPDASPTLTAAEQPAQVTAGDTLTFHGKLSNVVPGTAKLSGQTVSLNAAPASNPDDSTVVATAVTGANAFYTLKYQPQQSSVYTVSTGQITQEEYPTTVGPPVFKDILQPASAAAGTVTVKAAPTISSAKVGKNGNLNVLGSLSPTISGSSAMLNLFAKKQGSGAAFALKDSKTLKAGSSTYVAHFTLPKGKWVIEVQQVDSPNVVKGHSGTAKVTVP